MTPFVSLNTIILIISLFASRIVLAQGVASGDGVYKVYPTKEYNFIFPQDLEDIVVPLKKLNDQLMVEYQKSFGWTLDEKASLVLASSNNEITNAFATNYPNILTTFFRGGPEAFDSFATTSWVKTLLIHETAHLYQLNPKRELSKFNHAIFGNNIINFIPIPLFTSPFIIFPLPTLTTPNMFLPTWIVEGNAVFNESRFGIGGRLYSGETIALVNALLKYKNVDEITLTNNHIDFPYGKEKYLLGGMIQNYLAQIYNTDKVNHYFYAHAIHYLNPLRLNFPYEIHFQKEYSALVSQALSYLKSQADQMQLQKLDRILLNSYSHQRFNRHKENIFFTSNDSFYEFPYLVKVDGKTGAVSKKRMDISKGKVFILDGAPYTAASSTVNRTYTITGLWGTKETRKKEFDHLWPLEVVDGKKLVVDVRKSFDAMALYLDGKYLDEAHSSAIFDEFGRPVYFKQSAKVRTLYVDKKPLVSFQSYFSYPVDARNGEIYFISNTAFGSGLFVYSKGEIYRLGQGDSIVDARLLGNGQWFLGQITADGYQYGTVSNLERKRQTPHEIKYNFEKDLPAGFQDSIKLTQASSIKGELHEYNSLRDIRYGGWGWSNMVSKESVYNSVNVHFTDPALFNSINASVVFDDINHEKIGELSYFNQRYFLNYGLIFEHTRYKGKRSTEYKDYNKNMVDAVVEYPIARVNKIDYRIGATYGYGKLWKKDVQDYSFQLKVENTNFAGIGLYPHKKWLFTVEGLVDDVSREYGAYLENFQHLGHTLFLGVDFAAIMGSDKPDYKLGRHLYKKHDELNVTYTRINVEAGKKNYEQYRLGANLIKLFDFQFYHQWIPVGIRRIGPKIIGNVFFFDKLGKDVKRYEYGGGMDFELLLLHIAPFTTSIDFTKIEQHHYDSYQASFKLGASF